LLRDNTQRSNVLSTVSTVDGLEIIGLVEKILPGITRPPLSSMSLKSHSILASPPFFEDLFVTSAVFLRE
jgi:hypothetical protein